MSTGTIEVKDEDKTWENLRSQGMSFKDIINTIKMPHMALLRNLRNIFKELTDDDREIAIDILNQLKDGVKNGKQFPFRYYSALKQINYNQEVKFRPLIIDTLEECIDISIDNMPKLKGKTMCLSDNSGSACYTFNS